LAELSVGFPALMLGVELAEMRFPALTLGVVRIPMELSVTAAGPVPGMISGDPEPGLAWVRSAELEFPALTLGAERNPAESGSGSGAGGVGIGFLRIASRRWNAR